VTPIRTDGSNEFAYHTVTVRLPAMIDGVLADNPDLPSPAATSLRELQAQLTSDAPLAMYDPPAPDYDAWKQYLADHQQRLGQPASWQNSEWFLLEHFFFRMILGAVDYFQTQHDPFAPAKTRELAPAALGEQVDSILGGPSQRRANEFADRLCFSLWGNRMDLSHSEAMAHASGVLSESDGSTTGDALIADDSQAVWEIVQDLAGPVHFVCDNAGTELAADLCLADWLIQERGAVVCLQVKCHPTFVSDATETDVHQIIDRFASAEASLQRHELARRLSAALSAGRLIITADLFWNSPLFFDKLPDRIHTAFAEAGMILIKGDMNYRRLLGDRIVPAADPLQMWAPSMPAPTVMLRTMKGDPIAGIDPARLRALDQEHPDWRTAGKHGVIQLLAPHAMRT